MKNQLVSIITVTFNSAATIRDTIESILIQDYENFEYIIVDGKSTDNTIEIIESYRAAIKKAGIPFKFISEKDKGIADAWNKGISLSTGIIIGMLNSDDWYDKTAISKAVNCLDPLKPELSYGICNRVNESKEVIEIMNKEFNPRRIYINFGFSFTTCFFTKTLVEQIGTFNTSYKIAIDTDFLLRAFNNKTPFIKCNNEIFMRLGGISTKFEKKALMEYQMALKNNGFNTILIYLFGFIKRVYLILKN